jgi:hypothetical protein
VNLFLLPVFGDSCSWCLLSMWACFTALEILLGRVLRFRMKKSLLRGDLLNFIRYFWEVQVWNHSKLNSRSEVFFGFLFNIINNIIHNK